MDFGIMFFSCAARGGDKYGLLVEAAKFADEHGFNSVWTPERHFHEFGGLFPNPAVTSAALAMATSRIRLHAGSLISPLHDPLRIAEEWAVVDNLSGGRVGISFGAGWNVGDFVFFPERYAKRQAVMFEQIEAVRRLWAGARHAVTDSFGKECHVEIYPKPVQRELPVWVTSSGNVETFVSAGAVGANVLTHLIGQDIETLAEKIARYRAARAAHGHDPAAGKVTLMLHTFLGDDEAAVKAKVRAPFREYLRSAVSLEEKAALSGGAISGGHKVDPHSIPGAVMEELLDLTFERYYRGAALMGTPDGCRPLVWRLKEVGVDEIACLIDFLDDRDAILDGFRRLDALRRDFSVEVADAAAGAFLNAFVADLEGERESAL